MSPPVVPEVEVSSFPTLKRLVGRFRPVFWASCGVFLLLMLRSVADLMVPFVLGRALDKLVGQEGSGVLPDGYLTFVWLLGGLVVAKAAFWFGGQVASASVSQRVENRLRADLFQHVTRLRFTYHDENRSGKTIARSLRDMEKTKHFFREVWFGYVEILLILVVVIVMTFLAHWSYGVTVCAIFTTAIIATILMGGRVAQMDRVASDQYDNVTNVLQENIAGARVVRAFGREPQERNKFGGKMDTFTGSWARIERFWTGIMPWIGQLYHMTLPAVIVVGAYRYASGAGSVGEVASVLLYVRTVHYRVRPLTRLVILGQAAVASASRVFEVLDRVDVIEPPAHPVTLPANRGDLQIDDVWFDHAGGQAVLRGVSFDVPTGGSLGILGITGSGKSTLVHLIPRFYDPDRGTIRLGGVDIKDLAMSELRSEVGLVFQEPFLFSGSVADNIAYGNPGIERARIEECCRLAAADEFVRTLPDGYETVIGERGVSLSGGQRQRLTIARALAMDPRVLVFDDATASVDAVTEKKLFAGIRAAAEGRTTLVISQRVTSVRWCDRVAVLEDGAVTAIGTHAELSATSELYREILSHQELKGVAS